MKQTPNHQKPKRKQRNSKRKAIAKRFRFWYRLCKLAIWLTVFFVLLHGVMLFFNLPGFNIPFLKNFIKTKKVEATFNPEVKSTPTNPINTFLTSATPFSTPTITPVITVENIHSTTLHPTFTTSLKPVVTPSPVPTPTLMPTSTPSPFPTSTPTLKPTTTPSSVPTPTPTIKPTPTSSPIPTSTPTLNPTATPLIRLVTIPPYSFEQTSSFSSTKKGISTTINVQNATNTFTPSPTISKTPTPIPVVSPSPKITLIPKPDLTEFHSIVVLEPSIEMLTSLQTNKIISPVDKITLTFEKNQINFYSTDVLIELKLTQNVLKEFKNNNILHLNMQNIITLDIPKILSCAKDYDVKEVFFSWKKVNSNEPYQFGLVFEQSILSLLLNGKCNFDFTNTF